MKRNDFITETKRETIPKDFGPQVHVINEMDMIEFKGQLFAITNFHMELQAPMVRNLYGGPMEYGFPSSTRLRLEAVEVPNHFKNRR